MVPGSSGQGFGRSRAGLNLHHMGLGRYRVSLNLNHIQGPAIAMSTTLRGISCIWISRSSVASRTRSIVSPVIANRPRAAQDGRMSISPSTITRGWPSALATRMKPSGARVTRCWRPYGITVGWSSLHASSHRQWCLLPIQGISPPVPAAGAEAQAYSPLYTPHQRQGRAVHSNRPARASLCPVL